MFSTPLISCSSGVATVRATVSAEAPGYGRGDLDRRRHDLRILRDRQDRERAEPDQRHEDAEDSREERTVDEEVGQAHVLDQRSGVSPR